MRITDVRTVIVEAGNEIVVGPGRRTWMFVEIETDEGVLGVGECSQSRLDHGVAIAVREMTPWLVGRDPVGLVQPFVRAFLGNPFVGRVRFAAVSGVEQALWDLAGKALGVPVYQLLGGALTRSVPLYANLSGAIASRSPEHMADAAAAAVAEGYDAVKIYPLPQDSERSAASGSGLTAAEIDLTEARVRAVREAIGPDVRLHTDWAWALGPGDARRVADRLAPYDLFWIEEPFARDDAAELARLRASVRPRVAGGEQLSFEMDFRALFEARALDVVMPDVKWIGGLTGYMRIATLAGAFGVEVSPHNMSGPVATAVCAHLAAAFGALSLECGWNTVPWREELTGAAEPIVDGHYELSDAPGFGVPWQPEAARRYEVTD
ncbi:MAG: mandelate racemase/muconate lactonizing enzyme family protein [Dehalococcoidia bacterium]